MTDSTAFVTALERLGVTLVSGVPCSSFAGPIRLLGDHPSVHYVAAANEGAALAVAAGAGLAGARAAVIVQNSGFGNLVNPLTSLALPYRIPLLVFVSMRGWPTAGPGEPQHHWMGRVVAPWLDTLEIPHWTLTADGPPVTALLDRAGPVLDAGGVAFVLVGKGAIRDTARPDRDATRNGARPDRDDLVDAVVAEAGDRYLMSTTGYLSRALVNRGDRDRNFYMQGSMGHVAALALGSALTRPRDRFVVLDGDGAALMHMGTMATVGAEAVPNLAHVVFDNGVYDSTGGQPTASAAVAFEEIGRAVGYRAVRRVGTVGGLRPAVRATLDAGGPALLVVDGNAGGSTGERASNRLTPPAMTDRFRASLRGEVRS
jgi:phosphonopyruvate decarboxylase